MDDGPHLKRVHDARFASASFDSPCSRWRFTGTWAMCIPRFRLAENSSEAAAGNVIPIVHTGKCIDPSVQQAGP